MLKQSIKLIPAHRELYRAKLGFYLFLTSLGMFFLAGLLTYLLVRNQSFQIHEDAIAGTPMTMGPSSYEPLVVPMTFWISTALLIGISIFLQLSVWAVRRERQVDFRRWLHWSFGLSLLFVGIQCIGMNELFSTHFSTDDGSTKVFGMSFVLAFIHALHVLGGMIFLGIIIYQAHQERYDHERHWVVDHCASYWHFLDVVWGVMLVTFVVVQ